MEHKKTIKKQNQHLIDNEIQELKNIIPLVLESSEILKKLGAESIAEFEFQINEKSGFVNALLSSEAYGYKQEYIRLLQIQMLVDTRLLKTDLTSANELKSNVIKKIEAKHIEYFTDSELETKKILNDIIESYNKLTLEDRKQIGYGRQYDLVYSPFSKYVN